MDSFQSALLRIEQGLATWRDICDCAQMDIGCLEHLIEEVQQGQMELCPLSDLPIPPCPWRNITQMTSQLSFTFEDDGRNPSIVSRSLVNSCPQGNDLGNVLPPTDTLTATSSPMAILTAISSPPDRSIQTLLPPEGNIDDLDDNNRDGNFPSPVSSTKIDWEMSEDGSNHESSDDFVMSGDSDADSFSSES